MTFVEKTVAWLSDPAHWQGSEGIPTRIGEHLELSVAALLIASALALPAGLLVGHARRGGGLAVGMATIGRAIPSFALMGLILPFTQAIDP
ncbi:MAG: ABC transporter permease, partial [Chloroflexi bacterium]